MTVLLLCILAKWMGTQLGISREETKQKSISWFTHGKIQYQSNIWRMGAVLVHSVTFIQAGSCARSPVQNQGHLLNM